jgi:hypothetical protein
VVPFKSSVLKEKNYFGYEGCVSMKRITKLRQDSIVMRSAVRRDVDESADSWEQLRFIGGLILLSGILSLILTSNVRSADGGALLRSGQAIAGFGGWQWTQGDCDGKKAAGDPMAVIR